MSVRNEAAAQKAGPICVTELAGMEPAGGHVRETTEAPHVARRTTQPESAR